MRVGDGGTETDSGAQWSWICTSCCENEPVNKTWLDVEVLYSKFIGQIPRNFSWIPVPVMHLDQCVGVPEQETLVNSNNSQGSAWEEWRSGTRDTSISHLTWGVRELLGLRGKGCRGFDWCRCWYSGAWLVPLRFAYWDRPPEARSGTTLPVCSISARYLSPSADRWRVLHPQPTVPVGDDLLIFVWFLHPTLIEIHTASLAWLSLA